MNAFVSKLFPFIAGICSIALIAADVGDGSQVLWLFRTVLAVAVAIIAWFLKRMVDDSKIENDKRDAKLESLLRVTTAHEVMYQFWLEELAGEIHPIDGQRKTDKLHKLIVSLAELQR